MKAVVEPMSRKSDWPSPISPAARLLQVHAAMHLGDEAGCSQRTDVAANGFLRDPQTPRQEGNAARSAREFQRIENFPLPVIGRSLWLKGGISCIGHVVFFLSACGNGRFCAVDLNKNPQKVKSVCVSVRMA